ARRSQRPSSSRVAAGAERPVPLDGAAVPTTPDDEYGNVGAVFRAYTFARSASPTFGEQHENSARVRVCVHVADRRLCLGAAAGGIHSADVRWARQGQERIVVEGGGRGVGQVPAGKPERAAAQRRRHLRALGHQQGRQSLEGRVRCPAARRRGRWWRWWSSGWRSSGRRRTPLSATKLNARATTASRALALGRLLEARRARLLSGEHRLVAIAVAVRDCA